MSVRVAGRWEHMKGFLKGLDIAINVIVLLGLMLLISGTWMGYIAEYVRPTYDYKWLCILGIVIGFILKFFNKIIGLVIIVAGFIAWKLI